MRALVQRVDPLLPLYRIRTVEQLVEGSVAQQRFQMLLVTSFSLLMLILAAVGTYGVTAYGVSERTNELGIRAALGASRADLRRQILGESARTALAGIAIGALATIALAGTLRRVVFGMSPFDPMTFVAATVLLSLAVLVAAAVPAHRAASVEPMRALRAD
jgi:ABC-type antimicrobial peptide transport system permease subunit